MGTRAQNSPIPTVGYLSSKDERAEAGIIAGIRKGLAGQGLFEGQNVTFVYRWSGGDYSRLRACRATSGLPATLARELGLDLPPTLLANADQVIE